MPVDMNQEWLTQRVQTACGTDKTGYENGSRVRDGSVTPQRARSTSAQPDPGRAQPEGGTPKYV